MMRGKRILAAVCCVVCVSAGTVLAAPEAGVEATMPWKDIVQNGGWLMVVLAAISVLMLAMVIYFLAVLRTSQIAPRRLYVEVMEKIRDGKPEDARRACENRPSQLSAVCLTAMDHIKDVPKTDAMLLKDIVEGEGARQAEAIQGQTQYLMDIAAVAPMIGLLGTVFGMLRAFSSVALDIAKAKPVVLAAGVSQALVTTAFGLMVGIPAMLFYAFFRRRASKLISHLEALSADVLTALLSQESE
ncbi:MAG: MotA/TolQ/ExbB proton channel family protein [Lentisphaerae bacterium]|nr:MotA/TolQ/ExbB proton channel family protein [Lentisphaerota bacterium]